MDIGFYKIQGLHAFRHFFCQCDFLHFFEVSIFKGSFVKFFVHWIVFGLQKDALQIQQGTTDSYAFVLDAFRIFRHFWIWDVLDMTPNQFSFLSHWFWVHFSEHLQVIQLISFTMSFLDLVLASTFNNFLGRSSSTLMRFQTMSYKLKALYLIRSYSSHCY